MVVVVTEVVVTEVVVAEVVVAAEVVVLVMLGAPEVGGIGRGWCPVLCDSHYIPTHK